MKKKAPARLLLGLTTLLIALLACNFPTGDVPPLPTETIAPTITAVTATPGTQTPTATPTTDPAVTPTATVCTYNARFLDDVTVPDGTAFESGDTFDKTWRMDNTGCLIPLKLFDLLFCPRGSDDIAHGINLHYFRREAIRHSESTNLEV